MGAKSSPPDERVVYLALKNVFKGPEALLRQNRKVQKLIKKHQGQENIADLVREHNFDVVCSSARTLLCDDIFASTLKAKIRFPELFDLSPTQSADREASEAEAARHEASAIEHAVQGQRADHEFANHGQIAVKESKVENATRGHPIMPTLQASTPVPPLVPAYLPFRSQHALLVHLQSLLEHACYDFGKQVMADTLESRGWDCAEAVELNRWTDLFRQQQGIFTKAKSIGKPLDELFCSLSNLRHTAVHRLRASAKGVAQFLIDAEALTILLGDPISGRKVSKLRRETLAAIGELERNKHFLRQKLERTLTKIAAQREELKHMEEMAIAEMEREEMEYKILAGNSIDDTMAPSEVSFSTAIDTGKETITGLNDTDGTSEDDNEEQGGLEELDELAGDDWEVKVLDPEQ